MRAQALSPTSQPAGAPASAAAPGWPASAWQVRLLGTVEVADREGAGAQHVKLPSRAAAALIARLALWPERAHAREELVELLWPGVELDVGRNRLRQTLSVLKKLLEDNGAPGRVAIVADRQTLRAAPAAFACDVREFEVARRGGHAAQARAWYRGELMPGFYDEWIADERTRLDALFDRLPEPAEPTACATPQASVPAASSWHRGAAPLPNYLTPVFGIDLAGARLREAIAAHRLVTVLGPGGGGKTRLAVEVARTLAQPNAGWRRWEGWVAFVPMVACETAAQLVDRLAMALRDDAVATDAAGAPDPYAVVVRALSGQSALLLLDNLEQALRPAAELIANLLGELPLLHIVATSRHVLGVDGEHLVPVDPLPLPATSADGAQALRELALVPAVALYVDRARERRSDFHLTARNAADVAELVRRLEGHPLAIELAAARVRSTAPAQWVELLRERASDTLALLARQGPRGQSDSRHASMLDVIAWSWHLLGADEQALLCALTVFDGGCDAAGARAVGAPATSPAGVQIVLDELVSSSLIVAQESADGPLRFAPYEVVRDFAAARADADACARWRARHRAWLAALGRVTLVGDATPDLHRLRAELPNLLRGLASALDDAAVGDVWAIVWAHRAAWSDVTLPATGLAQLERALAATSDAGTRLVGQAFLAAQSYDAGLHAVSTRHADAVLAQLGTPDAIAAWPANAPPFAADDEPIAAWAASWALRTQMRVGRPLREDDPWLAAALAAAEAAGARAPLITARLIGLQASLMMRNRGDHVGAEPLRRRALALCEASGNRLRANEGRIALAICLGFQHRIEAQLPLLAEAEHEALAIGQPRLLCFALSVRGYCLADLGRFDEARSAFHACLRHAAAAHAWREGFYGLWNLTRTLAHLRQPDRAAELMGFAERFYAERFGVLGPEDTREARRTRRLCAVQMGVARTQAAWQAGAAWSLQRAMATALHQTSWSPPQGRRP